MAWRFVQVLIGGGRSGVDAVDVNALLALRERALADPRVSGFWWFRLQTVHGERLDSCPCGLPYTNARTQSHASQPQECRCGLVHLAHRCAGGCGQTMLDPPLTPGCGPLPYDPDAQRPSRR